MKQKGNNWGGKRPGAGRPRSPEPLTKKSVMVTEEVFETAMNIWGGRPSHLVNHLLKGFVEKETGKE